MGIAVRRPHPRSFDVTPFGRHAPTTAEPQPRDGVSDVTELASDSWRRPKVATTTFISALADNSVAQMT
jgi:hypothetical protein